MKNKGGITLIALVITIIVLLILTGTSITISSNHFNNVKLKAFYTKLEVATEGVEKINNTNETYKDEENNTVIVKQLGANPTQEQISLIESLGYNSSNFKYFTAEQVESILEISGVNLNLLIDFDNNIVINPEGIEIDGQRYYTMKRTKYSVQLDETKISGPVDFNYTVQSYGNDKYKIDITPVNIGNIRDGIVKYKKSSVDYWTVAKDNVIIVSSLSSYDIMYTDANGNTITKSITLSKDIENNVVATV